MAMTENRLSRHLQAAPFLPRVAVDIVPEYFGPVHRGTESPDPALATRALLEQARGMLMMDYGVPQHEAFGIMVRWCAEWDVTLRDVAETLVSVGIAARPRGEESLLARAMAEALHGSAASEAPDAGCDPSLCTADRLGDEAAEPDHVEGPRASAVAVVSSYDHAWRPVRGEVAVGGFAEYGCGLVWP
jgi:ANTAR domain